LKKNINLRGRAYESSISDAYLQKLEDAYLNYFKQVQGIAILLIDSNQIDFVNRKSDYTYLQELTNHVYAPGIHRFG
jgi:deoxyadenosine/deoxycytidine kinase